ncbi:MAG TPA: response regulator transcription factor [Thermoanaerobaculaceae bacterium]|nr:response regulator transcription factor [Thermoanaerobaculaceae bacterium]
MRKLVIVADNVEPVREAIKQALEAGLGGRAHEVEIALAGDGNAVLALCRTARPDLILMDVEMPDRDGVDTFYALKALDAALAARVVFLTGYAGSESVQGRLEQAIADGAGGVIGKPASAAQLHKALERFLAD